MSPAPVTSATFQNVPLTSPRGDTRIRVGLTWRAGDPAAVTMWTHPGPTKPWILDRGDLTDGIDYPVGDGDITIAPLLRLDDELRVTADYGHTEITIRDHTGIGGNVAIQLPTAPLARFLRHTYIACPRGSEVYDMNPAVLFNRREKA